MRLLICILGLFIVSCAGTDSNDVVSKFNDKINEKPFTIVITYSNECPVCVLYTSVLRDIFKSLPKDSFQWIFLKVNANEQWDFLDSTFTKSPNTKVSVFEDHALDIAGALGISMFPEVVVLDKKGRKLYSGAIDNRVKELGTMHFRPNQSEEFLKNAIQQIRNHRDVTVSHTPAKGCYIEFPKKP